MTRVSSSSPHHNIMMTRPRSNQHHNKSSLDGSLPFSLASVAVVASLLLVAAVFWTSPSVTTTTSSSSSSSAPGTSVVGLEREESVSIESGVVGGIPYYHCSSSTSSSSSSSSTSPRIDLVLLHGSRFTKEDWKTSHILQKFCSRRDGVAVTALDLSVSAKHKELLTVMDALGSSSDGANRLIALPVAGLVTPSASGTTVLDAITSGNVATMKQYTQSWIPVAANAALQYTADQLAYSSPEDHWPILSIYGDRDEAGKRSSELLQRAASARVVQLRGSHPCYLDSPDAFVETVLEFVSRD